MERKAVSFEQLSDIIGFRVIVGSVAGMLRRARRRPQHLAGRAGPLQGLHLDAQAERLPVDPYDGDRSRVASGSSLQIRTAEMDRIAEYGIAAHALYKDDVPVKAKGQWATGANGANGASQRKSGFDAEIRAYQWLRHTIEMLAEGDTPEEFLEHTKLELFQDQVFCFTPKGRLIALPRGATPIDFAYAVHTDVGDTCVGGKINGRTMPLMTELQNGDEVEIVCSKAQVPPAAWESMVVTGKARSAIRRATRTAVRRQYAGLGRRILERGFERAKHVYSDELMKAILPRLAQSNLDDALAAVGRGEIPLADVLKAAYPDHKEDRPPRGRVRSEEGWFGLPRASGLKFRVPGFSRKTEDSPKADPKNDRAIPIRGPVRRPAGAFRRRRRAAGRTDRRDHDAGGGGDDLSDHLAGAEGLRRRARPLAGRALGDGRGCHRAVSGAD